MERATATYHHESVGTRLVKLLDDSPRELRRPVNLRTLTVLVPLIHNPNKVGIRMPVWFGKIWKTLRELPAHSSGMKLSLSLRWCAQDRRCDIHLCLGFDAETT